MLEPVILAIIHGVTTVYRRLAQIDCAASIRECTSQFLVNWQIIKVKNRILECKMITKQKSKQQLL